MDEQNNENIITETQRHILADHLGLTPEYVAKNKEKLDKINDIINNVLIDNNTDNPEVQRNKLRQLQDITIKTYRPALYDSNITEPLSDSKTITDNGFRMIYGNNQTSEENDLINYSYNNFSAYRNLVPEYRNITRLIPEIHRCAEMTARDILSTDETTKKAIQYCYRPSNITKNSALYSDETFSKDPINKRINEEVLSIYNVEKKLQDYFIKALEEGARPVVVYPYKDILSMAEFNLNTYKNNDEKKFKDIYNKNDQDEIKTIESLCKINQKLIPDDFKINKNILSRENFKNDKDFYVNTSETLNRNYDSIIYKYITKEDFKEYCTKGIEDLKETINKLEDQNLMQIGTSDKIDKIKMIEEEHKNFRKLSDSIKIDANLELIFKDQIYNAIKTIDEKVEFYNQSEVPMAMAINNFRKLMKFGAYHEDPNTGIISYNTEIKDKYRFDNSDPTFNNINKEKIDGYQSVLDEYDEDFSPNRNLFLNDCLIKEYDAEDVIPFIVSGKHVGYHVIEVSPYTGNYESINKNNSNFTDLFISLGFNNDMALSPSMPINGALNSGLTQASQIGGFGPLTDIPALGMGGPNSIAGAGAMSISQYNMLLANADDAIHRNSIMKKIMFSVLKEKIKYDDLEEDRSFVEALMNLIRDGAIVNNNVRIMYVPEKYMCYFTPKLDGNGIPQSFMKDSLFLCYEKILVNMNNILTRLTRTGIRDKITVNVSKAKNLGLTIRSIENSLSTRRLNVESPFTSLTRVLKSSSLSETIIVPVYNGEKLFEYEDISQKNEVPLDDDLDSKLMNNIITSLKCPVTIMNPYQEEDFASIAASRNAEYRLNIINLQSSFGFGTTSTKFLRLLIVSKGLDKEFKKIDEHFSLKNVNIVFNPPETLNITTANEKYGVISSYIDNIIQIITPEEDNIRIRKAKQRFKIKIYQELYPGLELSKYIDIWNSILKEFGVVDAIDEKINQSADKQIENTDFLPIRVDKDGKISAANEHGFGNADDTIGDSNDSSPDW